MFTPLHDRIVVERIEQTEQAIGGIIIPKTAEEKPAEGRVVFTGPGKYDKKWKFKPVTLQPGDLVLFGKYSGEDVKIDGKEYVIMREDDIVGRLKK